MLNFIIYALISTIMLGFTCLRMVATFDLVNPKHVLRMKILRPCASKKIVKKNQRHPTWTNRGQKHRLGVSREKQ